jgi:hypothetical protein
MDRVVASSGIRLSSCSAIRGPSYSRMRTLFCAGIGGPSYHPHLALEERFGLKTRQMDYIQKYKDELYYKML